MRLLVVLAVASVLVAGREAKFHEDRRLMASAMRIRRLYHELEELDHEIDEAAKVDPIGFVMEMHARMDEIEGK